MVPQGDLARLSGSTYTWGREARTQYNESMAGTDSSNHADLSISEKPSIFAPDVSPFVDDSNTTLLPTISGIARPHDQGGQADHKVMSYCFRMCLGAPCP